MKPSVTLQAVARELTKGRGGTFLIAAVPGAPPLPRSVYPAGRVLTIPSRAAHSAIASRRMAAAIIPGK